jgi:hypothetical protein
MGCSNERPTGPELENVPSVPTFYSNERHLSSNRRRADDLNG